MATAFGELATTFARTLHKTLDRELSSTLENQLNNLPSRYFRAFDPGRIQQDLRLIQRLNAASPVVEAVQTPRGITLHVLLKEDQPGIFVTVVAILVGRFINVEKASVYTGLRDRMVLDHFELSGPIAEGVLERVCGEIHSALGSGTIPEPFLPWAERAGLTVTFEPQLSQDATVLTVAGRDQMGFLYRIARCFHERKLNLLDAFIRTRGDKAVDTFYITDESGKPLSLSAREELRGSLFAAFE